MVWPVARVLGEVWHFISDDTKQTVDEFEPRFDDGSRWYVAYEDGEILGAFWARRINHITWELHANIRPAIWGHKRGTEICREALEKMMEDTGGLKFVATIPDNCPQVQEMAEAIGFEREGASVRSWQKNGELYDQVYYGITRT